MALRPPAHPSSVGGWSGVQHGRPGSTMISMRLVRRHTQSARRKDVARRAAGPCKANGGPAQLRRREARPRNKQQGKEEPRVRAGSAAWQAWLAGARARRRGVSRGRLGSRCESPHPPAPPWGVGELGGPVAVAQKRSQSASARLAEGKTCLRAQEQGRRPVSSVGADGCIVKWGPVPGAGRVGWRGGRVTAREGEEEEEEEEAEEADGTPWA